MPDPYLSYVNGFSGLLKQELPVPDVKAVEIKAGVCPPRDLGKKCVLMLSPHPDDECLTGALPLRLKQEAGWQVINLAVTLGSKTMQRFARLNELAKACAVTGFDVCLPEAVGFSDVRSETREMQKDIWNNMVKQITTIIEKINPSVIMIPHRNDQHYTHIGTHLLGMDALALMRKEFSCSVVQTEYWHPNEKPNVIIGLKNEDAALLLKALCCYEGENRRNAYNIGFPAYLTDNVRRGSERVGGEGGAGANMDFAMLYRMDKWENGGLKQSQAGRIVGPNDHITDILAI